MEGESVASNIFRKKNQALTMETNSYIKIQDEHVHAHPQLLFQRLVIIGTNNGELQKVFDHELCQYPPALFDSVNSIRLTTKSSLADALWCSEAAKLPGPSGTVHYVLDGGALLHRVPWAKGATYDQICEQYSAYVTKKYRKATVAFDGYSNTSTKDCSYKEITWQNWCNSAVYFFDQP